MTKIPRRQLAFLTLASVFVLLAAGCAAKTIPTKGILTLDGKPLANASVVFVPEEGAKHEATGQTGPDGSFQMTTFRLNDGVLRGSYKITVHYSEPVKLPEGLTNPTDVQKAMAEAVAARPPTSIVPEIYSRPDLTPLKHKVPDDGDVKLELRTGAAP